VDGQAAAIEKVVELKVGTGIFVLDTWRDPMLLPEEKAKLEEAFSEAEANVRLEGLEPTPFAQAIKDRVLVGDISLEQAEAELCNHYLPATARIA
jgi:hypothetical protein